MKQYLKGERGKVSGRGYAWPGIDSTACPGVGVAIKMRPRQAKHNVYVYILHVFRISYMGLPVLVLYVCMLYGLRSIVGANKRPAASAWQICRLLLRDYAIKLAV